ncbi:MAG: VWA domain-containing protein [Candidatus Acidiferrales bacterium]
MFIGRRLGSFLVVILLCAAAASAQQPNPPMQASSGRISLQVEVTEKSGQPVADLQQQDFTLLDNKAPQTITSFRVVNGREASLEAIVVIDAVNAPYQSVGYERVQIDKFLRDEEGNLAYPVALAVVTDKGTQVVGGFSNDGKALSALLDKADVSLRDVGRSAGYYGAEERLQLSLAALRQLIASAATRPGRKLIIWISPGWPLMSGPNTQLDAKQQQQVFANIVSLSTQLRRAGVAIDSIDPVGPTGSVNADWSYEYYLKGVSKPSQVQLGNLGLPVLAVQSGGVAFNFTNGIADRLHKCLADAAPYYEISFDPPAAKKPDEYHHLEIKLAKSGLIARTLQGYYAQP